MSPESMSEERQRLVEQLREPFHRRPVFNDPELQADYDERQQNVLEWFDLWDAYRHPGARSWWSAEQLKVFESKYERCARVEKLRDVAIACERENEEKIIALRKALHELAQKKVDMAQRTQGRS
jgi:hypothetical protein